MRRDRAESPSVVVEMDVRAEKGVEGGSRWLESL
jgi:hypothetical protein